MKLLIVHLSDIHFCNKNNALLNKKNELCNAVRNNVKEADGTIIIVSGDIAYSGKKEEYQIAEEFFTELLLELENHTNALIQYLFVPGNHDCDFSLNESVRKILLRDTSENVDEDVLSVYTAVQEDYNTFAKKFNTNTEVSSLLYNKCVVPFGNETVCVNSYNTAFCSQMHELPGTMWFPTQILLKDWFDAKYSLSISVFHHRANWLKPDNARTFMTHMENTSNIMLCGHEHIPSKKFTDNLDEHSFLTIEGGVLQDSENPENSSFNVIQFDLADRKFRVASCNWNGTYYSNDIEKKEWSKFEKGYIEDLDKLHFSHSHWGWLNNIGANFTHPLKSNLCLDDLFVYPNVRKFVTTSKEEEESDNIVSFKDIVDNFTEDTKNLIMGNEKAGKTTLCKILIKTLYKKGFIPIYIKGRKISSTGLDDFKKMLKQCYIEQYVCENKRPFEQVLEEKLYLIIDNFDRSPLNAVYKNKFITAITSRYANITLLGNDLFTMQEMFIVDSPENVFSQYNQYTVLEFGHLLRYKLIDKWNSIGQIETIVKEDLYRKNDESERIINSIIGPNFIPSYPIFLLTILQSIEAGTPHDLKESSYGHYYQVLILSALGKIVRKNEEIEKYYIYLSELSYYFFSNKINEISREQFESFHDFHYSQYRTKMSMDETLKLLSDASLLEQNDNSISFKYRYVYYFFIGKYLADNLQNVEIQEILKKMARKLHETQCANIILFLTHHSKDPFILNEIASVAKEQFVDFKIVEFDKDVNAINNLIQSIPEIAYDSDKEVESTRIERLKKKDYETVSIEFHNDSKPVDLDDDLEPIDLISKLNSAFKTMEILGQALKNHYASIKAIHKINLVEEVYFLGLRTLDSFYRAFEESNEFVVNQINDYLEERNKKSNRKIEFGKYEQQDLGRLIVFNLASQVTYNFIKKITSCIGTDKLKEIYPDIVKNNNFNSIRIINFSIQLEYLAGFPLNELRKMKDDLGGNLLAYTIVRKTVVDYLYMYPLSVERKQQIGDLLSLSMKTMRRIEAKSAVRKK